ncbi:MAG: ATP synthase F1 subunit delta [Caldilineaceae bacterium]|nr:ATP synthase F1 subunit delta [Caldilineaceae bacterium]
MSERATAERYAQAILEAIVEQWQTTLTEVADALAQDPKLGADVDSIEKAIPKNAGPELQNFVKMLVQEGDATLLPRVVAALGASLRGDSGPQAADITSAVELDDDAQEKIRQRLAQQYGEDLVISFDVDPSLMGGLRIRVGDQLIDNTVANRLMALREMVAASVR